MKNVLIYFFGQGTEPEFSLFTFAHFAPIALLFVTIFLIRRYRESLRTFRREETLRLVLAFALILCDMSYYWRLSAIPALSEGVVANLPLGVCAWSVIFSSYMIATKNQTLFDIVYFWLLACSSFALLTPTPITYTGPTRFRYYQFWLEHTLGYVAIFYMIFVHNFRPTLRSLAKSYILLWCMVILAYFVNLMIPGANYLYMARPEAAPSILDILPANFALRVTIMGAALTALFFVAYLPWYLKDKKHAKV